MEVAFGELLNTCTYTVKDAISGKYGEERQLKVGQSCYVGLKIAKGVSFGADRSRQVQSSDRLSAVIKHSFSAKQNEQDLDLQEQAGALLLIDQ